MRKLKLIFRLTWQAIKMIPRFIECTIGIFVAKQELGDVFYEIAEGKDISYAGVKRTEIKIYYGEYEDDERFSQNKKDRDNLRKIALIESLRDKRKGTSATTIFFYENGHCLEQEYTVAMAEYCPGGVWADAHKNTPCELVMVYK